MTQAPVIDEGEWMAPEPEGAEGIPEERALSTWADLRGYEWADDGTDDISPPFPMVKIAASGSRMDNAHQHVGEWYHSDRDDYTKALDIIILKRTRTRALFGKASDIPLCSSADGIAPKPGGKLWQMPEFNTRDGATVTVPWTKMPERCDECPFSGSVADDGEWESGYCRSSRVYLAVRDDGSLALVRATASQASGIERFIKQRIKGRKRPLLSMRLTLTPVRVEPKNGNPYFEVKVAGEEIAAEYAIELNDMLWREEERFAQALSLTTDDDGRPVDTRTGEVIEA